VRDYPESELADRYIVDEDAAFPRLIRQGRNTWKLVKKGEHIAITMNGDTLIASFDIGHYAASQFLINIHGDLTDDGFLGRICNDAIRPKSLPKYRGSQLSNLLSF
jgi:hypothetical protein